jgi:hypothetical protein
MNTTLTQLRDLLQSKFPAATATLAPTAPPVSLQPTLLPGKLIEISSLTSTHLLHQLIQSNPSSSCALIDSSDSFDPASTPPALLSQLLWLRCQTLQQALKAADLLLRDGNLPIVLIDLRLQPTLDLARLPNSTWHRLRLLAERSGTAVALFTPAPIVPCTAQRWPAQPTHQPIAA